MFGFYLNTIENIQIFFIFLELCQSVALLGCSHVGLYNKEYLTIMGAPWLFAQWGLDILGPFSMRTRQMKFLMIGIDYFTKWVEVEPLAKISEQNVKSFVQKNIIFRFRIPRVLVLDNRRQFDNIPFREFREQLGIKNHYPSPSHPQFNGQAEIAN